MRIRYSHTLIRTPLYSPYHNVVHVPVSFAKGVIAMLQRVARRQNAAAANRSALRAAPSHERAAWDQLPPHAIASLADPAACHAVLDDFLGEGGDWCVASLSKQTKHL